MNKKIIIVVVLLIAIGYIVFSTLSKNTMMPKNSLDTMNTTNDTAKENLGKKLTISQTDSKAEFSLNELLNGKPTLVVGTTNQVMGTILLKADAPAQLTINEVKVDASTLKTDNEKRNSALMNSILKSTEPANKFISFKTTKVKGVPNKIEAGQEFNYYIAGELTIKGVTKLAIFEAKGTLMTDGSFKSTASTTIAYADYGITIPSLPFISKVDKTTKVNLSIIAK